MKGNLQKNNEDLQENNWVATTEINSALKLQDFMRR